MSPTDDEIREQIIKDLERLHALVGVMFVREGRSEEGGWWSRVQGSFYPVGELER